MIKVTIVEDNEVIREGLRVLINGTHGFNCIGCYADCESLLNNIRNEVPDVLLMDIYLPGMSGIEGIRHVRELLPELAILMLTIYDENDLVFEALCAGACGYLVKKTPPLRLLEAIRDAFEGGSPMSSHIARKVVTLFQQKGIFSPTPGLSFTTREREVLNGLAEGKTYQAIADSIFISVDTVRYHIRNIYKKLHVNSQTEAIAKAFKNGLI